MNRFASLMLLLIGLTTDALLAQVGTKALVEGIGITEKPGCHHRP